MPSIADAFGPRAVRASMDRQLVPGCVVRINVRFPQGTKPKFLVFAGSNGDALFFIVSSKTNEYVARRPELNKCQVTIDARDHPFLDHDSKVACHEVWRFKREDVLDELCKDVQQHKGAVSRHVRDQIVAAAKAAITIDPATQTRIAQDLA